MPLRRALQRWLVSHYGIRSLPLDPTGHRLALIALDSSLGSAEDGVEHILMMHHDMSETDDEQSYRLQLISRNEGEWQETLRFRSTSDAALFESLATGDVELSPLMAAWLQQVRIGDAVLLPCIRDSGVDDCMPPLPVTD